MAHIAICVLLIGKNVYNAINQAIISLKSFTVVTSSPNSMGRLLRLKNTARQPAFNAPFMSVSGLSPIMIECSAVVPAFCSA